MAAQCPRRRPKRMQVARKAQAARFAANVVPIIREIQAAGYASFNAIAGQLNARKVATANGGRWRHVQVRRFWIGRWAQRTSPRDGTAMRFRLTGYGRVWSLHNDEESTAARVHGCRK